jgi:hypothetical protein
MALNSVGWGKRGKDYINNQTNAHTCTLLSSHSVCDAAFRNGWMDGKSFKFNYNVTGNDTVFECINAYGLPAERLWASF